MESSIRQDSVTTDQKHHASSVVYPERTSDYPGDPLGEKVSQIRILTLLPGTIEDPIRCTLHNVTIDTAKDYEALSYTWGKHSSTATIMVNEQPLRVRRNLINALFYLRRREQSRTLWIDAVCINQNNVNERNHQVQRMAQIFTRASTVLVWLGLETNSTKAAFEFLSDFYLRSPRDRRLLKDDSGWDAIGSLCENNYWQRVWIVQEICVASRVLVVCGKYQIPWKYLSELRKSRQHVWTRYLSQGEHEFLRSLPSRIDQQREARRTNACSLWALLENFKDSLCQVDLDRVYGFLGLSTDCGCDALTVDYSKSMDQLLREVLWYYQKVFQKDQPPYHSPQLMKLSEFLQSFLEDKIIKPNPYFRHGPPGEPENATVVQISASGMMVIEDFMSAINADLYGRNDPYEYSQAKKPHQYVRYWQDLMKPSSTSVFPYRTSEVSFLCPYRNKRKPEPGEEIRNPLVFAASHFGPDGSSGDAVATGIAPEGSQKGDVVLLFVDTQIALVMRECQNDAYHLIGRAFVDFSRVQSSVYFKSQLAKDKTVETIQLRHTGVKSEETPWPAKISMDLRTLTALTRKRPGPYLLRRYLIQETHAKLFRKRAAKSEIDQIRSNTRLRMHV